MTENSLAAAAQWIQDFQNDPAITLTEYGHLWLNRARFHLFERLDAELREGPPAPKTEDQARSMMKGLAHHLVVAANALDDAAKSLKDDSQGYQASQAKQAATRARDEAEGY